VKGLRNRFAGSELRGSRESEYAAGRGYLDPISGFNVKPEPPTIKPRIEPSDRRLRSRGMAENFRKPTLWLHPVQYRDVPHYPYWLTMKTRLFVGAASESLDVAYAVQEELDRALEVTVWTQGIFEPSRTTMETLTEQPKKFDAALFVFTPDDAATIRGESKRVVRDNVVFELGLFVGALGRQRTFVLIPRDVGDLHLPSDLAGITPLDYNHQRQDNNLVAAVGPACNKIKKALIPGYGKTLATDKHDSASLERLLMERPYRLVFNPKSKAAKRIVFGSGGIISEGNNRNEHKWRLSGTKLELLQLDGKVFSRFAYDAGADKWKHTNETDTLSIKGQYLEPER
jgi:hypothetical protein